jgi:hypothetical protein
MSTNNAHATLRGKNVDDGNSVSRIVGEKLERQQSFPKHSQCPPLGRPPPTTYLNGIRMILMIHPRTVMTSRHILYIGNIKTIEKE